MVTYMCQQCNKVFKQKSHYINHVENKKYPCVYEPQNNSQNPQNNSQIPQNNSQIPQNNSQIPQNNSNILNNNIIKDHNDDKNYIYCDYCNK